MTLTLIVATTGKSSYMPSHPPKWAQKALLHYFVLIKSVCRIIYFLNCTKLECIILGETTNFYGRTSVPLWISCLQENSSIWLSLFRWPLKLFHLWEKLKRILAYTKIILFYVLVYGATQAKISNTLKYEKKKYTKSPRKSQRL